MSTAVLDRSPVLAELVPSARVRDIAVMVTGTGFITVAGQIAMPLRFTPVSLSFAVLPTGAAVGPARAAASVLTYMVHGLLGVPLFAELGSGLAFASFGYIVGYLLAVLLVGTLARRGADQPLLATIAAACAGSVSSCSSQATSSKP